MSTEDDLKKLFEIELQEKFGRDLTKLLEEYHCYLSVNIERDQKNTPCDTADLMVNFMNKTDIVKNELFLREILVITSKDGTRFFNSM